MHLLQRNICSSLFFSHRVRKINAMSRYSLKTNLYILNNRASQVIFFLHLPSPFCPHQWFLSFFLPCLVTLPQNHSSLQSLSQTSLASVSPLLTRFSLNVTEEKSIWGTDLIDHIHIFICDFSVHIGLHFAAPVWTNFVQIM